MSFEDADTVPFEALTDEAPPWLVNRDDTEEPLEVYAVAKPSAFRGWLRRRVKG